MAAGDLHALGYSFPLAKKPPAPLLLVQKFIKIADLREFVKPSPNSIFRKLINKR
jgi:hypothetical protein